MNPQPEPPIALRSAPTPRIDRSDFEALVAQARAQITPGERRILGLTGSPGAGKSTLAEQIVERLKPDAVLVPMDGFHLAEAELHRMGSHSRKGAIDTFDAGGYVSLLRRLKLAAEPAVYAPVFRRDLEEAIAGSIRVGGPIPLVVTEGNYLLSQEGAWTSVRELLDECWYLEIDEDVRLGRLVDRHVNFGRSRRAAEERARSVDQRNAKQIEITKERADLIITGT